MLIMVGRSASGKTQIVEELVKKFNMQKLVTYTTRKMRVNEVDGRDYHFITFDDFQKKISENFFLEYVFYNNALYGTSYDELGDDKVVILEPKGLKTYLEKCSQKVYVVYLNCSREVLRLRMKKRKDNEENIKLRLKLDDEVFTSEIKNLANLIIDSTCSNVYDDAKKIYQIYQEFLYERS